VWPEQWQQRAQQESLMGRWGVPGDVAAAVSFLCQAEANFISGQVLPVNGGFRFGKQGDTCVDGTLGGGGHSREILDRIGPKGHLIGLDRDPLAVQDTESRINDENATLIASNYADLPEILQELEISSIDSVLLDLGLSSDQLAARDRGFSFNSDGPLDLRFNMMHGEPAHKLLNRLREKPLADLLYQFGEEKLSRRIARKIVKYRHSTKVVTADHLARIVRSCYPKTYKQRTDPATRTFQALRIAVNEELKWLGNALKRFPDCLAPGGRFRRRGTGRESA